MKAIFSRIYGVVITVVLLTAFEPIPVSSSSCGGDWDDLVQRVKNVLDCPDSYAAFAEID